MKVKYILFLILFALIGGGLFYLSKTAPGRGGVEMLEADSEKTVDERDSCHLKVLCQFHNEYWMC
jgi:hypothetical protein